MSQQMATFSAAADAAALDHGDSPASPKFVDALGARLSAIASYFFTASPTPRACVHRASRDVGAGHERLCRPRRRAHDSSGTLSSSFSWSNNVTPN